MATPFVECARDRAACEREGAVDGWHPADVGLVNNALTDLRSTKQHPAALVDTAAWSVEVVEPDKHRTQLIRDARERQAEPVPNVALKLPGLHVVDSGLGRNSHHGLLV